MKPTRASSENHFTNGCTFAAKRGNRARIARPARNGTPMIRKMSSSICQRVQLDRGQQRAGGRVQRTPQNATDERQHEDVDEVRRPRSSTPRVRRCRRSGASARWRCCPAGSTATRIMPSAIDGVTGRIEGQGERDRRQHDELGEDRDHERLGLARDDLEVLGRGVERDAEHDESEHDVQDDQRAGRRSSGRRRRCSVRVASRGRASCGRGRSGSRPQRVRSRRAPRAGRRPC